MLFVDGIRFNDPAAGNEARFELLTSDCSSRIEVVRGPQSALWGSEALGGVIAAETADPFAPHRLRGAAEYGSLDSARLLGRYAVRDRRCRHRRRRSAGSAATASTRSAAAAATATASTISRATLQVEAPAVRECPPRRGRPLDRRGRASMTASIPSPSCAPTRSTTTRNRIGARARLRRSGEWDGWTVRGEASYLDSANRNRLAGAPLNSTFGDRLTLGGQLSRQFGGHTLIAAVDHQDEDFRARDTQFFGGTDQDRSRSLTAFVGEWRAEWSPAIVTDLAVRHDDFSAFARRDHLPRLGCWSGRRRLHPARRLWRGHRPADLLRSLRLLPRLVRRQSGR